MRALSLSPLLWGGRATTKGVGRDLSCDTFRFMSGSRIHARVLLVAAVAFLWMSSNVVQGVVVQKSFTTSSYITVFQKFGFDTNGTLAFDRAVFFPPSAKGRAFFYLCGTAQWNALVSVATDLPERLCKWTNRNNTRIPYFSECALSQVYFDDPVLKEYAVQEADMYRFVLLNCPPEVLPPSPSDAARSDDVAKRVDEKMEGEGEDGDNKRGWLSEYSSLISELDYVVANRYPEEEEVVGEKDTRDASRDKYKSKQMSVDLAYVLLNPDGHLPLGTHLLPTIYSVMAALWLWVVFLFGFTLIVKLIRYRANPSLSGVAALHWVLEAVLISKLSVVLVGVLYWRICDETGTCYPYLQYVQSFLFAISESLLFATLLIIAKGWRITRWSLPAPELRTMSVALILLLATLLFFSLYNDSYYFLSLMIMYFFMLPKILSAITGNLRELKSQVALLTRLRARGGRTLPPNLPSVDALSAKSRVFNQLRVAVVLYLVLVLIVSLGKMIVSWGWQWLPILANEAVIFVLVSAMALILRPRHMIFARDTFFDFHNFAWFNLDFLEEVLEMVDDNESPEAGLVDLEGQVSHVADIVVFQYPCKATEDVRSHHVVYEEKEEKEKEKEKDAEDVKRYGRKKGARKTRQKQQSPQYVSMYPLAIGTVEKPPAGVHNGKERRGKKRLHDNSDEDDDVGGTEGARSGGRSRGASQRSLRGNARVVGISADAGPSQGDVAVLSNDSHNDEEAGLLAPPHGFERDDSGGGPRDLAPTDTSGYGSENDVEMIDLECGENRALLSRDH